MSLFFITLLLFLIFIVVFPCSFEGNLFGFADLLYLAHSKLLKVCLRKSKTRKKYMKLISIEWLKKILHTSAFNFLIHRV